MISIGSIVNPSLSPNVCIVTKSITSGVPDPIWQCLPAGDGAQAAQQFECPESQLFEVGIGAPFPAGFAPGMVVEATDTGFFWGISPGPGVPLGRGIIVFSCVASSGGVDIPVAWVQLERGGPAVLMMWSDLTVVRPFVTPTP